MKKQQIGVTMRKGSTVFTIFAVICSISVSFADYKWNNPGSLPTGFTHATYHSNLMNVTVGYSVYLPPNYNSTTERYPVIYHLHGLGGNETSECQTYANFLESGIKNKEFPAVIMVFVNGRGNTFYSDSKDGTIKCESTIIQELIPHIDSTYRTKADRTQRAIEGFSMGGFGTLLLGFKHPDMFGSIGTYDAALVTWDTLSQQKFDTSIPNSIFGNDRIYFNDNSYPFTFAKKNANTIKSLGIKVRMSTGSNDLQMGPLYYYNLAMKDTLTKYHIDLKFTVITGGAHGSSLNPTTCKEYMLFHTANFQTSSTHVSKSVAPVNPVISTLPNSFTFSKASSFRIPNQWHQSADAVKIYDLNGRNHGQIIISGLNFIDDKALQERIGSGVYMLKAAK